jgi:hypothetical protein
VSCVQETVAQLEHAVYEQNMALQIVASSAWNSTLKGYTKEKENVNTSLPKKYKK